MHGLAQILENVFVLKKNKKSEGFVWLFRVAVVFVFCMFAWIFFASQSLGDAVYILKNMFIGIMDPIVYLKKGFSSMGWDVNVLIYWSVSLVLLLLFDYVSLKKDVITAISSKNIIARWCIYTIFILWLIFNIPSTDATEFIYFQF